MIAATLIWPCCTARSDLLRIGRCRVARRSVGLWLAAGQTATLMNHWTDCPVSHSMKGDCRKTERASEPARPPSSGPSTDTSGTAPARISGFIHAPTDQEAALDDMGCSSFEHQVCVHRLPSNIALTQSRPMRRPISQGCGKAKCYPSCGMYSAEADPSSTFWRAAAALRYNSTRPTCCGAISRCTRQLYR